MVDIGSRKGCGGLFLSALVLFFHAIREHGALDVALRLCSIGALGDEGRLLGSSAAATIQERWILLEVESSSEGVVLSLCRRQESGEVVEADPHVRRRVRWGAE
jgi:hypothetical protein